MKFGDWLIERMTRRAPDFVIGGAERPYLLRWFVIPRNKVFNVYLHQFLRSDDDRALHDHPWVNLSILLRGGYIEHTIAAGGIQQRETALGRRLALPSQRPNGAPHRVAELARLGWADQARECLLRRAVAASVLDAFHHRPALPLLGLPLP